MYQHIYVFLNSIHHQLSSYKLSIFTSFLEVSTYIKILQTTCTRF